MTSPTLEARPAGHRGRSHAAALIVLAFALSAAPAVAGCAGSNPSTATWTQQPETATPMSTMHPTDQAKEAAWAARPAYVDIDARTEEAYAYALAAPEVLHWMPCYCGCEAMGHGSNADCFFKPSRDGLPSLTFEEHGSFCGICVDTALMAKQMRGEGQSLRAIRDAVDARFRGIAPGTPTELPPA